MAGLFDDSAFEAPDGERDNAAALIVDVDGFEGPLDLLLELARRQKVDLARISILKLAEQYLLYVEEARRRRLELAADYLVMAAWLAYLKSRLLVPSIKGRDEPSAEELASNLAARLVKLEKVRQLSRWLTERHELGQQHHVRGAPEPLVVTVKPAYEAKLYDLLAAYAQQRQKNALSRVTIMRRVVWSLQEARETLERLIGEMLDWAPIDQYLLHYAVTPAARRSATASTFAASLEMVREGHIDMRQDAVFGPLYLRKRQTADAPKSAPNGTR